MQAISFRLFLLAALAFLFIACGNDAELAENGTEEQVANVPDDGAYTIDTFATFPTQVDDCSCYFAANEIEFERRNYVYVDDNENKGYLTLGGKVIEFDLDRSSDGEEGTRNFKGAHPDYTFNIQSAEVGKQGNTRQFRGRLTVNSTAGKQIVKELYGECNC